MKDSVIWVAHDPSVTAATSECMLLDNAYIQAVRTFHESLPGYQPTALIPLKHLAQHLNIGALFVKDESTRFGLNAFKVLGGSYAIARFLARSLNIEDKALTFDQLNSCIQRKRIQPVTFYTATDGNHGRGVAWAARMFNQNAIVFMPQGSSRARLNAIRAEGARACIVDMNYDDAVRYAYDQSKADPQGVLIQDTSWLGYETIPTHIMQGYGTMIAEACDQFEAQEQSQPTHVFVQAGVGSLAGSVQGFLLNRYAQHSPMVTVVEAKAADCLRQSIEQGKPVAVQGMHDTIMAGLACGEASMIPWKILTSATRCFASVLDPIAAYGMRVLAAPLSGDLPITSGESGAVGVGLLASIMTNPELAPMRSYLNLNTASKVLCISTEGDTDPQSYRHIVWDGMYPSR
ncbi:MAG: diaminopropionate ammonia-lyase [Eggerthellaceae bacterium]|nr:diaminopropionate ammonia-lyase [Eggerthellaceae bacterium]MCH4221471.1 diaminopropionate ammonia-lyase [Eggerthellaceae bacterium]